MQIAYGVAGERLLVAEKGWENILWATSLLDRKVALTT